MKDTAFTVWIEAEQWSDVFDPFDANSDVIVELENGSKWVATFVTFRNVDTLVTNYRTTGECLGGRYFLASNMILVDEINRKRVEEVIADLLKEGTFRSIFEACS